MSRMTTPTSGSTDGPDRTPQQGPGQDFTPPNQPVGHGLSGWSLVPLAVRIDGVQPYSQPGDPQVKDPSQPAELVPTARGIRTVLDHHRAVAACAEGPSYLQVAVLVDDDGRTATVAEDGSVVPGDAVEELVATVHRMTGQRLEAVHPQLRRALVINLDAPDLPLLAATAKVGFRAVSRDGWSIVVPDDENAWWLLRTGLMEVGVALSSDGAARSLEVLLGDVDPAGHTELIDTDAVCGLSWGPRWQAVSDDDATTAAGQLTREVVGICDADTSRVQIESVASVFDLDPVDTKRLANYVDGPSTPLVLESVLQLLGLPALAAKIVEGARDLEEIEGMTRVEPGTVRDALLKAFTESPTAEGVVPAVHRALLRRPELLLAMAGLELAAGTGLAALARRGGQVAPALGALSALAFTDAASTTAWYTAARRRKNRRGQNRKTPRDQRPGGSTSGEPGSEDPSLTEN
ncbi:hypothetical protein EDL96_11960 [Kocuria soli]|uniref:Uncharacterized protein n=2 Tax=Micrococcaceae TaxID=1268 RepID=A0A3N4A114_9MICC|nr:hypothetical protein EDL96_11960 [Kocuria soli]